MDSEIPGVVLEHVDKRMDERGGFAEIVRVSDHEEPFVQSNHSSSREGVLRGLHFHRWQADLWYLVTGRAQVALVDLRRGPERPQIDTLILDADEPTTLLIPPGVAHGFLALTEVNLIYWVTREYDASDEHGLAWDDSSLAIPWTTEKPILSERDRSNPPLNSVDLTGLS